MRSVLRSGSCRTSRPRLMISSRPSNTRNVFNMAALAYAATINVPKVLSARPEDEKTASKAHHNKEKGFQNPWDSFTSFSLPQGAKAFFSRRWAGKAHKTDLTPPPVRKPEFLRTRDTPKLRATWLGHACYYVEFPGGLRVLFDPVFTVSCSPFEWLGPKRITPQPCQLSEIPFIDAVMISHSHYDHLSKPTVLDIHKQHPNVQFIVPLGNKEWFHSIGIRNNVTELDWWDDVDLTLSASSSNSSTHPPAESAPTSDPSTITARISCLPSQHTSGRTLTNRNHTLWSSWAVRSGPSNLYFTGDTGYRAIPFPGELDPSIKLEPDTSPTYTDYVPALSHLPHCPAFEQIGSFRGPFDLGLIPIGAYAPRALFSGMHANPQDSVRIFKDLKCKRALAMHWGTWVLTEEDLLEPPKRLRDAVREMEGMGQEVEGEDCVFGVCDIGESREFESGGIEMDKTE